MMVCLADLPTELLERIFLGLGSIDDVHNLGRACRKTYDIIFQEDYTYVKVMRNIIYSSPWHRFDWQMCEALELHRDIVLHLRSRGIAASPENPVDYPGNWEMRLAEIKPLNCFNKNCAKCLPAARVHEIVTRWHGLRPLQTLWLERDLDPQDNIHVECHQDLKQLVSGYAQLQEREYLQKVRSIPTRQERHHLYTGFNTDQKGRFHAAVTYIWLLNELRWALTNYTWPSRTFASPAQAAHTAMEHLSQQQHTSMLDELDQYAMYRFLYHHLLPVHGAVLADQDSAKLPLTFPSNMSTSTAPRFLQFFLAAAPVYLQPPDIIELTVRSRLSRKPPYPLMRLPSSTESWLHPVKLAYPFPVGVELEAPIFPIILRNHFHVHLTVIARAFLSLTNDQSTRRTNISQVAVPCFAFEDHTYSWLMERVLKVFEEEARPKDFELPGHLPLTHSSSMLDDGWKDCMWAIWWWAGSEEKARAKMERWREIRRT